MKYKDLDRSFLTFYLLALEVLSTSLSGSTGTRMEQDTVRASQRLRLRRPV
jgi:hypothetical protein